MLKRNWDHVCEVSQQQTSRPLFVCHSDTDKAFAEKLCNDLKEASGCDVFFNGQFEGEASKATALTIAAKSTMTILVLSQEFFTASKWPMMQLAAILESHPKITRRTAAHPPPHRILPVYFKICISQFKHYKKVQPFWFEQWEKWAKEDSRIDVKAWKDAVKDIEKYTGIHALCEKFKKLDDHNIRGHIVEHVLKHRCSVQGHIPPSIGALLPSAPVQGCDQPFSVRIADLKPPKGGDASVGDPGFSPRQGSQEQPGPGGPRPMQAQLGHPAGRGPPMGWRPQGGPGLGHPQVGPSPYGALTGPRGGPVTGVPQMGGMMVSPMIIGHLQGPMPVSCQIAAQVILTLSQQQVSQGYYRQTAHQRPQQQYVLQPSQQQQHQMQQIQQAPYVQMPPPQQPHWAYMQERQGPPRPMMQVQPGQQQQSQQPQVQMQMQTGQKQRQIREQVTPQPLQLQQVVYASVQTITSPSSACNRSPFFIPRTVLPLVPKAEPAAPQFKGESSQGAMKAVTTGIKEESDGDQGSDKDSNDESAHDDETGSEKDDQYVTSDEESEHEDREDEEESEKEEEDD